MVDHMNIYSDNIILVIHQFGSEVSFNHPIADCRFDL